MTVATRCACAVLALLALACGDRNIGDLDAPLTIEPLALPTGAGAQLPSLRADATGRVVLSWLTRDADSATTLRFMLHDGREWNAQRTVVRGRELLLNWADVSGVAPTDDGRLVAWWMTRVAAPSFAYDLSLATSADGGATWTPTVEPHPRTRPGEHGFVSVASRAGGGADVVFLHGTVHPEDQYAMALQHVALAGDGSLLSADPPLDPRICDCCQTDLAVARDGPVAVYRDRSATNVRDIAIVRRGVEGWSSPRRVHDDGWTIDGCPVNGPAVAADGDAVVVAWFTAARDTARVRVAFSRDGGETFAAPTDLAVGPRTLGRVDVAWLPDGRALVSWMERDATNDAAVTVAAVSRDGRVRWEGTAGTTAATRASGFPRMTRVGDDVWLAWTVPGDSARIEGRRLSLKPPGDEE
jgi:hypothetical protein